MLLRRIGRRVRVAVPSTGVVGLFCMSEGEFPKLLPKPLLWGACRSVHFVIQFVLPWTPTAATKVGRAW